MNHTIKGIIIVVVITSMLVLGATTTVPIMQNSFASKKSDFKKSPSPATTLQISKHCDPSCSSNLVFPIAVTGNNPEPSSFPLRNGESQTVTLGPGSFTVTETLPIDFQISFSGDCKKDGPTSASGIISTGQTLTCTIMNHLQG